MKAFAALAAAVLIAPASFPQTVTIKTASAPALQQSFECAAVYAISLRAGLADTGKVDPMQRAALRGWLDHIRSATAKTNAELNAELRPVFGKVSADIQAQEDAAAARKARAAQCERAETRVEAPQPVSIQPASATP